MPYRIDVWGGDLHQRHLETQELDSWRDAETYMLRQVESGLLCNILHTDFKAPADRASEQAQELIRDLPPDFLKPQSK